MVKNKSMVKYSVTKTSDMHSCFCVLVWRVYKKHNTTYHTKMLQPISEIMSCFKNFEDSSLVFVLSYHFTWNTYGLHSCEATMFSFTLNFFRFCPCLQWNLQCSAYECFISKHLALIPYWNPVHFPGQFGIKHGGNGTLCFHFRLCHHFHEVWGLHVNGRSVFSIDCKEKKLNTYSTGQYI